ncbi:MAG: hypothetical protein N3A66_09975, partial [Planctomycetota bacterium]|nr:hypothetical protein [Planctomycetota bacterium]
MTLSRSRIVCLTLLLFSAIARSGEMSMAEAERLLVESKDADLLFSLSFYYEEAGRPFSALRAVERALEIEAKKPAFHARYGQLLLGRRRLQEAAAAYAKAAALAPDAKFFKATEARAFAECGRWAEAIS